VVSPSPAAGKTGYLDAPGFFQGPEFEAEASWNAGQERSSGCFDRRPRNEAGNQWPSPLTSCEAASPIGVAPVGPQDFHNCFYEHDLAAVQVDGNFDPEWWDRFIRILHSWRATRPYSFNCLTARAQDRFAPMKKIWSVAVSPYLDNDVAGLEWHQIGAFPELVAEIKPSPVFTAKFCHFLAPRIFPVIDNTAMHNPFRNYEEYFKAARQQWLDTDSALRDELVSILTKAVGRRP